MAISLVKWIQTHAGLDITGENQANTGCCGTIPTCSGGGSKLGRIFFGASSAPPCEPQTAATLARLERVGTRLHSLRQDLDRDLTDTEKALLGPIEMRPPQKLNELQELFTLQGNIFTKQLYELDSVTGDHASVRERRKHHITSIEVCLKDIEVVQGLLKEMLSNGTTLSVEAVRCRMSGLSVHATPATLDPAMLRAHVKLDAKQD
eukprot:RCo027547